MAVEAESTEAEGDTSDNVTAPTDKGAASKKSLDALIERNSTTNDTVRPQKWGDLPLKSQDKVTPKESAKDHSCCKIHKVFIWETSALGSTCKHPGVRGDQPPVSS